MKKGPDVHRDKSKSKPEHSKGNRFVWEDGDVEITPPKPGDPLPDPPKGPFDPIAAKLEQQRKAGKRDDDET